MENKADICRNFVSKFDDPNDLEKQNRNCECAGTELIENKAISKA